MAADSSAVNFNVKVLTDFSGSGSNSTGQVVTDIGGADVAYAVGIQPNGKILTAGFSDVNGTSDFALTRYFP